MTSISSLHSNAHQRDAMVMQLVYLVYCSSASLWNIDWHYMFDAVVITTERVNEFRLAAFYRRLPIVTACNSRNSRKYEHYKRMQLNLNHNRQFVNGFSLLFFLFRQDMKMLRVEFQQQFHRILTGVDILIETTNRWSRACWRWFIKIVVRYIAITIYSRPVIRSGWREGNA